MKLHFLYVANCSLLPWMIPSLFISSCFVTSAQALSWFNWDSIRLEASTEARNGGRKLRVYLVHVHSFHILALARFHHIVDNLFFFVRYLILEGLTLVQVDEE